MTNDPGAETERHDLLEGLTAHRRFLRQTVVGLSDEQARRRTTVSELCLGGVLKHVTLVERGWADFIVDGPSSMPSFDEDAAAHHAAGFRMEKDESLAGLLAAYDEVADRTNEIVATRSSFDDAQPLPQAPWFPPGTTWTTRRVLLHIIAETSQHAGHADIIREALDGAKTMG